MTASDILKSFIEVLDLEKLRLRSPGRFIFFCGGKIDKKSSRPKSLRDFLLRELKGRNSVDCTRFVLAESATQLFRDSDYSDLIAFESDIAQISDIVLIIAESPGSLTELGAFSISAPIAPRLKIIVKDEHYGEDSFIRHGPLKHMENLDSQSVLPYPWRSYSDNSGIIKASATPHLSSIRKELKTQLKKIAAEEKFDRKSVRHIMILIFWIIHVLRAATLKEILESLTHFGITLTQNDVRKFLYCMRVADWIAEKKYGHQFFYYARIDTDPFDYAFKETADLRDRTRWKSRVSESMKKSADLRRPKSILKLIGK